MKNKFFLFILVFFLSGSLTFAQEAPVETAGRDRNGRNNSGAAG